jgi:hypothetical protein
MVLYGTARKLESTTRNILFFIVVKYESESNRNIRSTTKIETLLCAAVGTAIRQTEKKLMPSMVGFRMS